MSKIIKLKRTEVFSIDGYEVTSIHSDFGLNVYATIGEKGNTRFYVVDEDGTVVLFLQCMAVNVASNKWEWNSKFKGFDLMTKSNTILAQIYLANL